MDAHRGVAWVSLRVTSTWRALASEETIAAFAVPRRNWSP